MNVEEFDKSSKAPMRSVAVSEAAGLLREIAGGRRADETVKGVLRRLSRDLVDWSYGRLRAVWYEDPRIRVREAELDQLRGIAQQRTSKSEASPNELEQLRNRIARLERLLAAGDPESHREGSAALEPQGGQVG